MDFSVSIATMPDGQGELAAALADDAFASIESHPQIGRYGREYYPAVHGDAMKDLSFAVIWQQRPVLIAPCSLIGGKVGLHGLPMRMFVRPGLPPQVEKIAVKAAFAHLDRLAEMHSLTGFWLRLRGADTMDPIGQEAFSREGTASLALIGVVDLSGGETLWKKALRKSFTQFVNWGRKSFSISYVNQTNCSDAAFDRYRLFHAEVAGRVTRSKLSWDVMQKQIAEGRGELILAELDGKLAAGSLFIDGKETSIYMNGVYDRSLDKPLAHYMVWHGIERAALRGMRWLELGDIHQIDAVDAKQYSIGYFKRGFATDIEQWTDWSWRPKVPTSNSLPGT